MTEIKNYKLTRFERFFKSTGILPFRIFLLKSLSIKKGIRTKCLILTGVPNCWGWYQRAYFHLMTFRITSIQKYSTTRFDNPLKDKGMVPLSLFAERDLHCKSQEAYKVLRFISLPNSIGISPSNRLAAIDLLHKLGNENYKYVKFTRFPNVVGIDPLSWFCSKYLSVKL